MKKRGFTLVEVLIAMLLISIIAAAFFPSITSGLRAMTQTKQFTESAFQMQTDAEQAILELNNRNPGDVPWGDPIGSDPKITIKQMNLFGEIINFETKKITLGTSSTSHGSMLLALPEDRLVKPRLPVIESVTLNRLGKTTTYSGNVNFGIKDTTTGESWEKDVEFNVFRWYIGTLDSEEADPSKLTLIQEYNYAKKQKLFVDDWFQKASGRPPESHNDRIFEIISGKDKDFAYLTGDVVNPMVDKDVPPNKFKRDFWANALNHNASGTSRFSEEQMKLLYKNKGLVFSAMPVSKEGLVGKEVYSKMVSMGYEEEELVIGMEAIPPEVNDTHKVYLFIKYEPLIKGDTRFMVQIKSEMNPDEIAFERVVDVDSKTGYYFFDVDLVTDDSYVINVKSTKKSSSLSASARIEFPVSSSGPIDLQFVGNQYEYKITEDNDLVIQLKREGNALTSKKVEITVSDAYGRRCVFTKKTDNDGFVTFKPNPKTPVVPSSTNLSENNLGSYLSIGDHIVDVKAKVGRQEAEARNEYILRPLRDVETHIAEIHNYTSLPRRTELVLKSLVKENGQPVQQGTECQVVLKRGNEILLIKKGTTNVDGVLVMNQNFADRGSGDYFVEIQPIKNSVIVGNDKRVIPVSSVITH